MSHRIIETGSETPKLEVSHLNRISDEGTQKREYFLQFWKIHTKKSPVLFRTAFPKFSDRKNPSLAQNYREIGNFFFVKKYLLSKFEKNDFRKIVSKSSEN